MTPEELRKTIECAKKQVGEMPAWKKGILVQSAESRNSTPRTIGGNTQQDANKK